MGRVSIVFEDGPNKQFSCQVEGIDQAALAKLPSDEWPGSAFYALQCFRIIGDVLRECGALHAVMEKPPEDSP